MPDQKNPTSVAVIITTHNNQKHLQQCLCHLEKSIKDYWHHIYIVADQCSDTTEETGKNHCASIIKTPTRQQWAKATLIGERAAKKSQPDYILWLNDQTFLTSPIETLLNPEQITIGAIENEKGTLYKGPQIRKGHLNFELGELTQEPDSLDAHCVCIPKEIGEKIILTPFDNNRLAELDFGLSAKKAGITLKSTTTPVGWTPTKETPSSKIPPHELVLFTIKDAWAQLRHAVTHKK
jgi:hypothetical protein